MNIVKDYFQRQASVLNAKYRASVIIGQTGDTGTNREEIAKEWLSIHVPRTVTVELGGKIIDSTGYISNQVDIVIYNNTFPHFGANPKSYFFSEGTTFAIQVKSNLTSGELQDAIKNLATIKTCKRSFGAGFFLGEPSVTIPTGIFSFDTTYSSSIELLNALKRLEDQGFAPVDFVYVNQKVYIGYNPGNWNAIDSKNKDIRILPKGYMIIENTNASIWHMVFTIAGETRKVVFAPFDFQAYLLRSNKGKPLK